MNKSPTPGRREHYRFETPLPAELAMARLHDLLPREVWGLQRRSLYQVSSKKLDDAIYFELRELVRDHRMPIRYVWVVRGQIREVDKKTTLVDCDLKGAAHIPHIMFGFALLVAGITLLLMSRGELQPEQLALTGAFVVLSFIFAVLSSNRKVMRDPALERIERAIRPRQEDRNLVARRQQQLKQYSAAQVYPADVPPQSTKHNIQQVDN